MMSTWRYLKLQLIPACWRWKFRESADMWQVGKGCKKVMLMCCSKEFLPQSSGAKDCSSNIYVHNFIGVFPAICSVRFSRWRLFMWLFLGMGEVVKLMLDCGAKTLWELHCSSLENVRCLTINIFVEAFLETRVIKVEILKNTDLFSGHFCVGLERLGKIGCARNQAFFHVIGDESRHKLAVSSGSNPFGSHNFLLLDWCFSWVDPLLQQSDQRHLHLSLFSINYHVAIA